MKKHLLKTWLFVTALVMGAGSAWAFEVTETYDFGGFITTNGAPSMTLGTDVVATQSGTSDYTGGDLYLLQNPTINGATLELNERFAIDYGSSAAQQIRFMWRSSNNAYQHGLAGNWNGNGAANTACHLSILNMKAGDKLTITWAVQSSKAAQPYLCASGVITGVAADNYLASNTEYTVATDGNVDIYFKNNNFAVSKIVIVTEKEGDEAMLAPEVKVTGVNGINRTITITPGVGEAGSPATATYYTTDGSDPTATNGTAYTVPFSISTTTTIKAVSYLDEAIGTVKSEEIEAGTEIQLNKPVITLSNILEGAKKTYTVSSDNAALLLAPTATYSYTFTPADGSDAVEGTGSTITIESLGTLTVVASAEGYTDNEETVVNEFEFTAGESLNLNAADVLEEEDAAWTYNSSGTRYANWSGYGGVSKANYPYWTPSTDGKGAIGNFTFEPGDNVLMRTIGFIHNSGTANVSVIDLPENTTINFVVSVYGANPVNHFVEATEGIATYALPAGNTGYAVESIQLFTKVIPPFDLSAAIVNASFEQCEAVAESVATSGDAAGTDYEANGWKLTTAGPTWSNAAVFAYGSEAQLNSVSVPAIVPEGAGEKALGVTVGWGGAEIYQSAEAVTLPAGEYTLLAYAYNANPDAQQMTSKLGFVPTEGEAIVSTTASYASGEWTVDYVTFTLEEATEGKFQIGGAAVSGGSGTNAKVFFDNLTLTDADGLAAAQAKAEAANEAIKQALIAANAALVEGATVENPVDAPFVVNGTFTENTNGWTCTGGFQNKGTASNQGGDFTVPFWENWNPSAQMNKMYQTIENIPNGVYKLKIAAFVNTLADPNESQFVFANDDKEYLTTGSPTFYEVYTLVENNTLEIGLEQTTATANWMGIDNVTLTYFGADATVEAAKNSAFLKEVAEALDAKQSVKTKDALQAANEAFVAESSDENKAALEEALAASKISINSYAILEAGSLPDNSLNGWTCTNSNTFHINTWSSEGNSDGTGMVTPFIENWVYRDNVLGTGEIYYSLPGLDPGIYQFSALIRAYSESGNAPTGASLFAGDREKEFATGNNFEYNGMKGIYDTYAMACEVGEDGIFRFGIKISEDRNFNWMAFKSCKVAYVGAAIDADAVAELAATMPEGKMNAEVQAAMNSAKTAAEENIGLDTYEAFAKAIATAESSVEAYKKMKAVLDEMAEILAATNVYTAEAYEAYNTAYEADLQAYNDGTIADADANAYNYGSRLAGSIPTLLLSAITSTVDGTPYINTWSVEGNNDGTGFLTPFFEYWTGDANSLGENTITATMNGLAAGDYDVTAWVRVRIKNNAEAPATGITLQANDGEAVDVCTGEKVNAFYLAEFTATGTVAEDGVLAIKFIVAADNNVSWLSFKNVKYVKDTSVGISTVTVAAPAEGIYNLAGQKVQKAQKGLYIINGKKVVIK